MENLVELSRLHNTLGILTLVVVSHVELNDSYLSLTLIFFSSFLFARRISNLFQAKNKKIDLISLVLVRARFFIFSFLSVDLFLPPSLPFLIWHLRSLLLD